MAEREVQIHGSRHVDRAGNRIGAGHADSRYAALFDFPGDQSDGLMADGSDGYQDDDIHPVFDESVGDGGGENFLDLAG